MQKLNVAILGATGAVGQRFVQLLESHPWFQVAEVIGSSRSAGRSYGDAAHWVLDDNPPARITDMIVGALDDRIESPLIFSALPKEAARCFVSWSWRVTDISYAAMLRPIACWKMCRCCCRKLMPSMSILLKYSALGRGWSSGALVANSNCTVMPVVMSLKPLLKYGIRKLHLVSEQAVSGAGYPGVPSMDMIDNIIPYVPGDEDKMESESRKMLGDFDVDRIVNLASTVSATCTRVPVLDGHLVNISLELEDRPSLSQIIDDWETYQAAAPVPDLPSAPCYPLQYLPQIDRPQPRRDRQAGAGMMTSIGRLRECPVLGYKFAALSHNTVRGAAGCSILNAELMAVKGYIDGFVLSEAEAAIAQ